MIAQHETAETGASEPQGKLFVCGYCSKLFYSTYQRAKYCPGGECLYRANLARSRRIAHENGAKPWGACIRCGRRTRGARCSSCKSLKEGKRHGDYCDYPALPTLPANVHEAMMDNLLSRLGLSDCADFIFAEASCLRGRGNSLLRAMTCERGGYQNGPSRIHVKRAEPKTNEIV